MQQLTEQRSRRSAPLLASCPGLRDDPPGQLAPAGLIGWDSVEPADAMRIYEDGIVIDRKVGR